jgi:hypothetical protein
MQCESWLCGVAGTGAALLQRRVPRNHCAAIWNGPSSEQGKGR